MLNWRRHAPLIPSRRCNAQRAGNADNRTRRVNFSPGLGYLARLPLRIIHTFARVHYPLLRGLSTFAWITTERTTRRQPDWEQFARDTRQNSGGLRGISTVWEDTFRTARNSVRRRAEEHIEEEKISAALCIPPRAGDTRIFDEECVRIFHPRETRRSRPARSSFFCCEIISGRGAESSHGTVYITSRDCGFYFYFL